MTLGRELQGCFAAGQARADDGDGARHDSPIRTVRLGRGAPRLATASPGAAAAASRRSNRGATNTVARQTATAAPTIDHDSGSPRYSPLATYSAPTIAAALLQGFVVQGILVLVTNNLWEEAAWTGFVQARLQQRHGAVRAALITGPLFALQHIALVFVLPPVLGVISMTVRSAALASARPSAMRGGNASSSPLSSVTTMRETRRS